MTKAAGKTGRASGKAASAAPAQAAAPAPAAERPKLVGDEDDTPVLPGSEDTTEATLAGVAAQQQTASLAAYLLGREGFGPLPDEGAGDAAIRVIGELDAKIGEHEVQAQELTDFFTGLEAYIGGRTGAPDGGEDEPLAARIIRFVTALIEAGQEGEDAAPDPAKERKAASKHEVALFADLPDTAALTLRFSDGGAFVDRPRDIARDQLAAAGAKVALMVDVDFAPDGPPQRVSEAFLIAGKKTLRCAIPGGLRVGGGTQARIPKGHLEFGAAPIEAPAAGAGTG